MILGSDNQSYVRGLSTCVASWAEWACFFSKDCELHQHLENRSALRIVSGLKSPESTLLLHVNIIGRNLPQKKKNEIVKLPSFYKEWKCIHG